jgi:arylsulfatase A
MKTCRCVCQRALEFAVLLILGTTVAQAADRPHVILIMADDIGSECFGCYGSRQYQTPNIDRLAEKGMRFTHCYSQPLCTPSRVKIMTGLSNARNYSGFSILNPDQKTIGHFMKDAGYQTFVAGKWQLLGAEQYSEEFRKKGAWPKDTGFDHHCLWQVDKLGSRYWQPLLNIDGETRQFGPDDYGPDLCAKSITNFLEKHHADEKPIFVYYPMILVHNPFETTPDTRNRNRRNAQKNFEDMVAYMDKIVGRIVAKTEELGIAENTLILYTADNGTNKKITSTFHGKPYPGGKGMTTDAGTREPFLAYWPGTVAAGKLNENLVDFSDFLPTLLEAAGAKIPQGLDGRSFLAQLKGEKGTPREWMYCYYNPRPERSKPVRFVRDTRYKLYGEGRFYDVETDPLEQNPLAEPNAGAKTAKEKLQKALDSMPAEGQQLLKFTK